MKRKIIPIKKIIKRVEDLSYDSDNNKKALDRYSEIVKGQKEIISRISINKIKNKLKNDNLTYKDYCKYKDLLLEKKYYNRYKETINSIIKKDYDSIYVKRSFKRKKMAAIITTGTLLLALGGFCLLQNNRKQKDNNKTNIESTTEIISEDTTKATTEMTTEITEGEFDLPEEEYYSTENTSEDTTEMTTEATTEMTTEVTTQVVNKEEPTTVTYVFIDDVEQPTSKELDREKNERLDNIEDKQRELEEYVIDKIEEITTETTTEMTTENTTETTTEATTETTTEMTTENTTETTTEATTETTTEMTTENTTEGTTEEIIFDDGVIDYSKFSKLKDFYYTASGYIDTMENTITDKEKRNEAKENAKTKVIQYIDFIFYGSEINGVTFDELKEDEKEKVYEQLQSLNEKISEKDPEYLDNMSERYSRLKDLGSLTLNNAKEKVKEKVGEDYYNDADQVKDDTIDTIKETGGLLKKFIKDKYEEWSDN